MPIILCLDVPAGTMVGVDLKNWVVGDRFLGVSGVPFGPHFLVYAAGGGPDLGGAITSGLFIEFPQGADDIWVGRWQPDTEEIVALTDQDDASRFKHGVRQHDFDSGLGPYPRELFAPWRLLSGHLNSDIIRRLAPIGQVIHPTQAPGADASMPQRTYYTDLEMTMPRDDPAQVTADQLDRSRFLELLVERRFDGVYDDILGELQFAFIAFFIGQSFVGFEQWKRLVRILCSCEAALWDQRLFFGKFIDVLAAQLELTPNDFFNMELTANNFLHRCLLDLFELGQETALEDKLTSFRRRAEEKFQWRFPIGPVLSANGTFDSDDEDAPAVVVI